MSTPEFSRTVRLDTLGTAPRMLEVAASPEECAAIARRFRLASLDRLEAQLSLARNDHDIVAAGRITAQLAQSCVVTGEPVPEQVDEPFELRFRPEPAGSGGEEEVELGEDELDVIFYDGALVDVGEAVAQTLALSLDPYPRVAAAEDALRQAGVKDEGEAGPFGALAALKDKLGR